MILKKLISLSGGLLLGTVLVSCGNKGDLFLIPDAVSQEDLQQLERALGNSEIPAAEPIDVDDQDVYVKPGKSDAGESGSTPVK